MNILKVLTAARRTGDIGELAAEKMLRKKGYKILERNYVGDGNEIDIIAKNREFTVFVEVKTRTASERLTQRAAAAVTPEKQRRIIHAATVYAAFHPSDRKLRFDVVEVLCEAQGDARRVVSLEHIEGAFNKNTAYSPR